jgi:hypothetical protein
MVKCALNSMRLTVGQDGDEKMQLGEDKGRFLFGCSQRRKFVSDQKWDDEKVDDTELS